ncbi:MAG: single-stranded DNA-binding protein [Erysipelotrichaceae bacterium]|nr:single-stranded DNA-binding protein [Erysipelotrichaceae bacterium]MCI9524718.1 single-stranded DNA-binding protein [Erysipelotrichaceae bacterium]
MINRVVLVGRITKDPMLRKTQSGASVVSFTLACNRRVPSQGQDADFINCVAWNKTADFMAQYVRKGALLGIEGRIQTRNYDDKDGKRVYVTEVVCDSVQFLESKKASAEHAADNVMQPVMTPSYPSEQPQQDTFESDFSSVDSLDIASDDLPF